MEEVPQLLGARDTQMRRSRMARMQAKTSRALAALSRELEAEDMGL